VAFFGPFFWVIILLGIMILVHEAGHFWAALSVGIQVETFSIGFGPRLFGFRRGTTDFRISAIPFGGYVRMLGDQPGDENASNPKSFLAKARWQRAIVIIAGPLMNVLLAIALVTGLYMHGFLKEVPSPDAVISSVAPGSAAALAGLQPGDRIVQLGEKRNPSWQDVTTEETLNANHALPVVVKRDGQELHLSVTPRMDPKDGIGVAGWRGDVQVNEVAKGSPAAAAGMKAGDLFISVNGQPVESILTVKQAITRSGGKPIELELMRNGQLQKVTVTPVAGDSPKLPWRIGILFRSPVQMVKLPFFAALDESLSFNRQNATMIFEVLRSILVHRVSPKALTGPVGISEMANAAAQEGPSSFIGLMAMVSLNLAIFNLLPIPILDGGTLLLLLIEMLLQREVSLQVKETVFKLGFVFLMMVVVFVIYNDISRILTRG
jgi:regulator of sigma E protease